VTEYLYSVSIVAESSAKADEIMARMGAAVGSRNVAAEGEDAVLWCPADPT
jgi:hypothetical protein